MTFRTTLFRALAAADLATCNGRRVTAKLLSRSGTIAPFVDLDGGATLYLQDAEVAVDDDGRAAYSEQPGVATALSGDSWPCSP